MNTEANKLIAKLKLLSSLWMIGGGVFIFRIFFPDIEYYGYRFYVVQLASLFFIIGFVGSLWFIKCPKCNKKLIFDLINKEHNLEFPTWENEIRSHKCFSRNNDNF
ncbi:hypothetical protein RGQ13_12805 [Thalassotalea psychrophila]|uniref:Uncharacterized protein n=1 Tax=Thalassotalea psychrophila TaxID=3065647 RepID=A0ABY9TR14_9GAMM|nr:hypothetical protein RGQ13_12805 [Colwelliaceae bacterium SQ149]